MLNSRLGLFSAAYLRKHPFSRSYGVNLPSSLTTLLPLALESSSYLPVSVCGTGSFQILTAYLVSIHVTFHSIVSFTTGATIARRNTSEASLCFTFRRLRNLYRMCIGYAFPPHLSSRLTLSGRTFLRNPQIFGGQDSHLPLATHANILSRILSSSPYDSPSARIRCSSTIHNVSKASVSGFSPVYLRRRVTRLVSYYALFK